MKLMIAVLATLAPFNIALAQMDLSIMTKGNGLAEVIYKADHCGYAIDQGKLDAYISANKLDSPEAVAWMSNAIDSAEFEGKPTASACTIAKAAARRIGVLEQ